MNADPYHVAEIQRLFCVLSNQGHIRVETIGGLLVILCKRQPQHETAQVMDAISGKEHQELIFKPEFEVALLKWIRERNLEDFHKIFVKNESSISESYLQRRRLIHAEICLFFTQFFPQYELTVDSLIELDDKTNDSKSNREQRAEDKILRLQSIQYAINSFTDLEKRITQTDHGDSIDTLEHMLQVVNLFENSAMRFAITSVVSNLLDAISDSQLPAHFINVISDTSFRLNIRIAYLRVLCLYAKAPKVIYAPVNSRWGYQSSFSKQILANVVPTLIQMLDLNSEDVSSELRREALVTLGVVGSDHFEMLQLLRRCNCGSTVLSMLFSNTLTLEEARSSTYLLSVICGNTHEAKTCIASLNDPDLVPIRSSLHDYIRNAVDWIVIENLSVAYIHLLVSSRMHLDSLMMTLEASISHISRILSFGNQTDQVPVSSFVALLGCIHRILQLMPNCQKYVALVVQQINSILNRFCVHIQLAAFLVVDAIIDSNMSTVELHQVVLLAENLIDFIKIDNLLKSRACMIMAKLIRKNLNFAVPYALRMHQVVSLLLSNFHKIRYKDIVLHEAYGFSGPVFDFNLGASLLEVLDAMLQAGYCVENVQGRNSFLSDFGCTAIERIGELVCVIVEEQKAGQLERWRQIYSPIGEKESGILKSLEKVIEIFLAHLVTLHQNEINHPTNAENYESSSAAMAMLVDLMLYASNPFCTLTPDQLKRFAFQKKDFSPSSLNRQNTSTVGYTAGLKSGFGEKLGQEMQDKGHEEYLRVVVTPINFHGVLYLVLGAQDSMQKLVQRCVLSTGTSVTLLYTLPGRDKHSLVTGQEDISFARALAASRGDPKRLHLSMRANFTQQISQKFNLSTVSDIHHHQPERIPSSLSEQTLRGMKRQRCSLAALGDTAVAITTMTSNRLFKQRNSKKHCGSLANFSFRKSIIEAWPCSSEAEAQPPLEKNRLIASNRKFCDDSNVSICLHRTKRLASIDAFAEACSLNSIQFVSDSDNENIDVNAMKHLSFEDRLPSRKWGVYDDDLMSTSESEELDEYIIEYPA